jgi:hypothetical protein
LNLEVIFMSTSAILALSLVMGFLIWAGVLLLLSYRLIHSPRLMWIGAIFLFVGGALVILVFNLGTPDLGNLGGGIIAGNLIFYLIMLEAKRPAQIRSLLIPIVVSAVIGAILTLAFP